MLTKLTLDFESAEKILPSSGSFFHGFLMETITPDYANLLHSISLLPFSQYVYKNQWVISTFTEDARKNIIDKLLTLQEIHLKSKDLKLKITKSTITQENYKNIIDKNFSKQNPNRSINFLTPTTYKSGGEFQNLPSLNALFISLYNKWNAFCPEISLNDEKIFAELLKHIKISSYQLKSCYSVVDGARINAWIGNIDLFFWGSPEIYSIANILLDFSTYTCIGAKTSMGMGAVGVE